MKSAIVTGDIVQSSLLSEQQEQELLQQLQAITGKENKLEFYRGDSFQAYFPEAAEALAWTLRARAAARSIPATDTSMPFCDIRASIGIGTVETPFQSLGTAKGTAFLLSGRHFDEMAKQEKRLGIFTGEADRKTQLLFEVIARYADSLFNELTSKQSEVIFEMLGNTTQQEISERLNKSQPTINRQLKAAKWNEIAQLLNDYKQVVTLA
ncbi:MAG: hypothetical protein ACO1NW_09255 [Chitinophagaceae bacterium]